jgi:sugar-specific transcriptional regulator TrmB
LSLPMQELLDNLQKLGFTQYEARAYVALLQAPRVTAYELAKRSGIPPSKIYEVVDKLVGKDLVVTVDDSDTARYAALDPEEVTARYRHLYEQIIGSVGEQLERVTAAGQPASAYVWSLGGRPDILAKAAQMVSTAVREIYLAVWPSELPSLLSSLRAAEERGVDVAVCFFGDEEPGVGLVFHHATDGGVLRHQGARRMVVSVDDVEALIAYFPGTHEAVSHWSRNFGFVQMAKDYIRHDIWIIKLVNSLGGPIAEVYGSDRERLREVFRDADGDGGTCAAASDAGGEGMGGSLEETSEQPLVRPASIGSR